MKTPARFDVVQPAMAFAAAHLDDDLRLEALSAQTGFAFHMHRLFVAVAGETPKAYSPCGSGCDSAAALLLASRDSIVRVSLSCGFASPEAFSRAFRRAFHLSPREYRARGFSSRCRLIAGRCSCRGHQADRPVCQAVSCSSRRTTFEERHGHIQSTNDNSNRNRSCSCAGESSGRRSQQRSVKCSDRSFNTRSSMGSRCLGIRSHDIPTSAPG